MVRFRRIVVTLLFAGMIAQINCVAVYYGLFAMNREAIAASACEMKTKDCCGHCFLNKKIASAEESRQAPGEKTPPNKTSDHLTDQMPGLEPCAYCLPVPDGDELSRCAGSSSGPAEGMSGGIDRPPEIPVFVTVA